MLGHEDGVSPHGSLLAIPFRLGGGETLDDESSGVRHERRQRTPFQITAVFLAKYLTASKIAFGQGREEVVQISHGVRRGSQRSSKPVKFVISDRSLRRSTE